MKSVLKSMLMLSLLLLSACGPSKENLMQSTLHAYGKAIRWGELEIAMGYIAPEYLEENPVGRIELARFKHLKVTHYREMQSVPGPDENSFIQVVRIRVVNIHTQRERDLLDRQLWKFDPEAKRWWNWSGLPEFAPRSGT